MQPALEPGTCRHLDVDCKTFVLMLRPITTSVYQIKLKLLAWGREAFWHLTSSQCSLQLCRLFSGFDQLVNVVSICWHPFKVPLEAVCSQTSLVEECLKVRHRNHSVGTSLFCHRRSHIRVSWKQRWKILRKIPFHLSICWVDGRVYKQTSEETLNHLLNIPWSNRPFCLMI
jgi:hypothetical protein